MMAERLECSDLLSLKEMAQRSLIVHLLIVSDVLAPISKFRYNTHELEKIEKEWRKTVGPEIKDRVSALNLPKSLTKQLMEMAKPFGLQIKRWKDRLDYHFGEETRKTISPQSTELFWTRAGLIDYHKTAKELVCCGDLDIALRFKVACMNCLEEDIALIWDELPREKKHYFCSVVRDKKSLSPLLHFCWPHVLRGKLQKLNYLRRSGARRGLVSFNHWAFEESAEKGNKMATEYFYQKLRPEERRASLMRNAMYVNGKMMEATASDEFAEVFFYLLSVMTSDERAELFKGPEGVRDAENGLLNLCCFFEFPWPDLFLESVSNFWRLIPPCCYGHVYPKMLHRLEHSDPFLPKVFPELFEQSPLEFRKQFLERECHSASKFLRLLLERDDAETVGAIVRSLDAEGTQRLLHRNRIFIYFNRNVFAGRWLAVEACLREARLPEAVGKTLGEIYRDLSSGCKHLDEDEKQKFKRFFEYFDRIDDSSAD